MPKYKINPYDIKAVELQKTKCANCSEYVEDTYSVKVAINSWNDLSKTKTITNKVFRVCSKCKWFWTEKLEIKKEEK